MPLETILSKTIPIESTTEPNLTENITQVTVPPKTDVFNEVSKKYLQAINYADEEQIAKEWELKQNASKLKIDENKKKNYYAKENSINAKINKNISERYGGICADEFGSSVYIKKKVRNVFEGYEYLVVPDEVRIEANSIYNNELGRRIKKIKKLSLLKFYCIYNAYKSLGITIVPQTLANDMKMDNKSVNKANTIFSELETGYSPPDHDPSPIDFLADYSEFLGIDPETLVEFIVPYAENFLEKNECFLQDHPHVVAAGIIKWYCIMNGLMLKKITKLRKRAGCSDATIDTMYKKIVIADS